ncbi:hypothetical protein [Paraglaciecola sp.]|uniref:hypothetical protein n=1 Tax=Paraglaciecola sp. TaxID=1920173 RepID=UPI003EF7E7C8
MTTAVGFKGRSNINSYVIHKDNQPFDLVAADVIKLEVEAGGAVIDSDSTALSFDSTGFEVEFGALDITNGRHITKLTAYTATDNKGKILIGPGLKGNLTLTMQSG